MISLEPIKTLKNKEFRNLLTGRFFLILAFRMLATLLGWWVYQLIDCQVYTEHLASLGAKEIPKREFLKILKQNFSDENVK